MIYCTDDVYYIYCTCILIVSTNCTLNTTVLELKGLQKLSEDDQWIDQVDLAAFRTEVKALGKSLSKNQGPDDVNHLNKIILWSNLFTLSGILTAGTVQYKYKYSY